MVFNLEVVLPRGKKLGKHDGDGGGSLFFLCSAQRGKHCEAKADRPHYKRQQESKASVFSLDLGYLYTQDDIDVLGGGHVRC